MRKLGALSVVSVLAFVGTHCSSREFSATPNGDAGNGAIGENSGASSNSGSSGISGGDSGTAGMSSSGAGGASGRGGAPNGGRSGAPGAVGDSGAAGEVTPPCDTTKSPSQEACVVSNDYAIFVAPTGNDGASGTKSGPVKTIAKAAELAGDTKILIACDGTYDEQVKLTSGAKIYGGFSCPGNASPWTYEVGKKAKVAPTARGIALSVAAGDTTVVIEDFEFDAKDGIDAGESSVAGFVNTSSNVALTRVKFLAGKGVDGANGTLTKVTAFPTQQELNGPGASGNVGAQPLPITCPVGGTTKGGAGGNGGLNATGGGLGTPDPGMGMGKGGSVGADCSVGLGTTGANAPPTPPVPGATKVGTITPAGWKGSPGADGAPGSPGQGGGGGAGAASGGAAGGGGAGGCGGAGGTGGKAGGSSIALLVLNSTVAISADEFIAGNAGRGGSGVAGQDAQSEFGAPGAGASFGCAGGKGGTGATGGAGGGAAGGISVGIAYQGMMPMPDAATTVVTGTAGAKGIGGAPTTNDGIAGAKQDVLQVP